ncbi:GMC family oxidoreductase [Mycolicibacterium brumae]|uniref:long-chain-alcohol oxidase n=1 Tax=Mycolicibacterium brumae TaxID=85968 RepID=A0A2G5P4T9_9MYCO|nr:GMC family oxidoreductase [Mycolicibacterium brumae]MCV7191728.1 GMC family oxidoreductase [Mycolicibacterium brumae]PIB73287.1 GMC oxidoreductase [Mycolicibacterium brumae]RWA17956.1 hypothetical protein MBRU_18205 [Mycolicibacterium brumae DSM 44177]UWW08987.1 GMC family oxidoreductase [Mycolicibacterium brumae]
MPEFTDAQRRTLTLIVDTFVASIPRDDDPTGFFATKGSDIGADLGVAQHLLTRLTDEEIAGLTQLFDGLVAFGFDDQPLEGREQILAAVSASGPEAALAVDALFTLSSLYSFALVDEQGRNPLWPGMGYPGPAQNPPQQPKTLTVFDPARDGLDFEVVVVGSGCGGGVAAAVLAEAGKRVLVLETGGYLNESDFIQLEAATYQNLFLRGGFFPTADGMVAIASGCAVGGGSTVNWSNSLRTPAGVRREWAEAGLSDVTDAAYDEHLDAVWRRIGANTEAAYQNGPHRRLSEGAAALGYSYTLANLNIDPERMDPVLIGYSGMGDQSGAKQGTLRTYLQDASDAGAKLLPNAWARRIRTADGAATGVEVLRTDPATGETSTLTITAPQVVVSCGSLETPALLLRSGIGGPATGTNLRLHPATVISGLYDEPQDPWIGPPQAGVMNEFGVGAEEYGFIIEGVQHIPGLYTTTIPRLGAVAHKEIAQQYQHRADWVMLIRDRGAGRVTIDADGQAQHWYPFDDEADRANFRRGIATAIRLHAAAGARQIFAGGQRFAPWTRGEDLEAFIAAVDAMPIGPGGLPVFSAHQMSSAPLGADPATSVAAPSGELHDTAGVWIADASGMPSCSGVNPMVSVLALAHRTATNMLSAASMR